MRVSEAMTPDVITVSMDLTLEELRSLFEVAPFHHLLVVEEGDLVGVVSDRDLLKNLSPFIGHLSERGQDVVLLKKKVHQIMTRTLVTVRDDSKLEDAARLMLSKRVSCLPVVDAAGKCAGIITLRDITKWAIACFEGCLPKSNAA